MSRTLSLLLMIFTYYTSYAFEASFKSDHPIEIISNSVKYMSEQNVIFFEGDVIATQDDIKLFCDKMKIILEKDSGNNKEVAKKIHKILFLGPVTIITPRETARSEEGEYDVIKEIFILRKNVSLKQGENTLYGDQLTYIKSTGESLLTATNPKSTRVKGVFTPSNKPNKE